MEIQSKKPNKTATVIIIIVIAIIIIALLPSVISISKKDALYNEALEKIDAEDYEGAKKLLSELHKEKYYKDSRDLWYYCFHRLRGLNDYYDASDAYLDLKDCEFLSLSEERRDKILEFVKEAKKGYDTYSEIKDEERKKEQEEYKKKREEEEREAKKVPWVGMPESQIASTTLGAPSSNVRHNSDRVDGEYISCNLYDFYDSEVHHIFTARCGHGRVINIWDYRNDPSHWDWDPTYEGKSRFDYIDDVDDYVNPDDFYYDHYDDFYDYEEAEDYYYSHGGR